MRIVGEFHSDYTEGNAWQYTWHVFQEPEALADLMGGKSAAVGKLDDFFSIPHIAPELRALGGKESGVFGQFWLGNEPSHHIVYFYTLFGAPEKAQRLLREMVTRCYRPSPDVLLDASF